MFTGLNILFTSVTNSTDDRLEVCFAIVDGGAQGTVIGLPQHVLLAIQLVTQPSIDKRAPFDPNNHVFGTKENHSRLEVIVGRAVIRIMARPTITSTGMGTHICWR